MHQTVTPLTVQLVKFHTSLQFEQVISRLDKETNKAGNSDIVPHIKAAKGQRELEALIHKNLGESGFLYFWQTPYHHLVERVEGTSTQPKLMAYIIGNPLIAQSILQNNRFAALNVPLKLLVVEKPESKGTIIAYYLPSSVMTPPDEENAQDLEKKLKLLDEKLEKLVSRVTAD